MTTKAKIKKSEYDLSDFAVDEGVSLLDAAPMLPEHRPVVETPYASPAPQPMPPAAPMPAREPERPAASAAPLARDPVSSGRANRVALTFWVTPELRRGIRQSMIGSLEGVYRTQGDLVEAAVRRFLNLG